MIYQIKKYFYFMNPIACVKLGFKLENIILSGTQKSNQDILECDICYCTEGNTFEVLSLMREHGIDTLIKEGFKKGNKVYIGCSAGASIAGVSIEEIKAFDRNFVRMDDFTGLGLFDGIIIPHYTKDELKNYICNNPGIEEKYKMILSVANDKSLVIDV